MGEIFGISVPDKFVASAVGRNRESYFFVKRLLDFTLAAIFLVLFAPLMVIAAILIKLNSPGPVFFRQNRVGVHRVLQNGKWVWEPREFTCLKFRTMVYNADPSIHQAYVTALIQNNTAKMDELQNGKQKIHKLEHDPRITKVGHFLRKSSLDELPQFFTVLTGKMSIVGPRPAIAYEVALYTPRHKGRLNAQPGITGLQQVLARCTCDFDDQVQYDLKYIEKQSLWLDLKIMLMTPLVVLKHKGAC
jgi:lipopolysaccharide/colanic/teichoic acid biosynthesis glycosyltransferase